MKYEDFAINNYQDNERKPFLHLRLLWPRRLTSKINRDHLLVMTYQYVKYEVFVINSTQDNKEVNNIVFRRSLISKIPRNAI
jgi:hypothetical protein